LAVDVAPPLAAAESAADTSSTEQNLMADFTDSNPSSDPSSEAFREPVAQPVPRLSPQDDADFLLHPVELARGRRAAENYLSSFRSDDNRKIAEEALETLATVISGGKCDSVEFPWQQVRPYHGAAALTILKAKGAPARIESIRCRNNTTRSYRVVPDAYPTRQVQKIQSTLTKVIAECCELGFVADGANENDAPSKAAAGKTAKRGKATSQAKPVAKKAAAGTRLLGDGELRALAAASAACKDAEGCRDSVFFSLVYRGLKIAEISGLTADSICFNNKTGACTIVAGPSQGASRGQKIELTNSELIGLEDWIDHRGDGKGPLLCTMGRGGKFEGKRLTTAVIKEICLVRAQKAKVAEFGPNDLSRSAQALTDHRKAARRKANRLAKELPSTAEKVLFESPAASDANDEAEAIQFPFLGLHI
jgi:hypothetical protein